MGETRDDLREALARCISTIPVNAMGIEATMSAVMQDGAPKIIADRLIAGPLAPILAQVSALQAEVERLHKVEGERDEAIAEVTARLNNYSLSTCLDCGGQGYTDQGKSACFWCRGAGVITQQMAHAFGVADRATATASDEHPAGEDPKGLRAKHESAVGEAEAPGPHLTLAGREGGESA